MAVNPTDVFKAVATPSPELQRLLAYAVENGSIRTGIRTGKEEEEKNESGRKDMTMTALQISEQERIHKQYLEQSAHINQAIELALTEAKTPEERQEILDYQKSVQKIDEDIEQKREAGILTQEHLEEAEQTKNRLMPDTVKKHMPEQRGPAFVQTELDNLEKLSGTSFAASHDGAAFDNLPDMNGAFQAAIDDIDSNNQAPDGPENSPITPSDLSKFTF